MKLPSALARRIENHISTSSLPVELISAEPVSGGCIHNASRLITSAGPYFVKWSVSPQIKVFESEVSGIAQIQSSAVVRTPKLLLWQDQPTAECPAFILMEWIEAAGNQFDPDVLGDNLACLHRVTSTNLAYGLPNDNFIGTTPQKNTWSASWVAFFRDQRLAYQMEFANRNGRLPLARRTKLEKLLDRLDDFLGGVSRQPSLLHGDLWTGNVLSDACSQPFLIDPAVYYGDREAELAYTELFGGFPPRFYQAYNSNWPLEPGYPERRDIYNLYHLLNHLNIFGEPYGFQVDAVLRSLV
jgi:protein-ribulosamine 3-kinase